MQSVATRWVNKYHIIFHPEGQIIIKLFAACKLIFIFTQGVAVGLYYIRLSAFVAVQFSSLNTCVKKACKPFFIDLHAS